MEAMIARQQPNCSATQSGGGRGQTRLFPRLRFRLVWPSLVLYCLVISGCGSGSNLATVRGKVTLNGQPLQNALVESQPTDPAGSPSSGITDAQGRYELRYTFDKPGATPGEHRHFASPACHGGEGLTTGLPTAKFDASEP